MLGVNLCQDEKIHPVMGAWEIFPPTISISLTMNSSTSNHCLADEHTHYEILSRVPGRTDGKLVSAIVLHGEHGYSQSHQRTYPTIQVTLCISSDIPISIQQLTAFSTSLIQWSKMVMTGYEVRLVGSTGNMKV